MNSPSNGIIQNQNDLMPEVKLNDGLMRLIGIPFFGIIIPHITGLFGHLTFQDSAHWWGYPYFILLSAFIWQGNRYLMFHTRKRFTWFDKPIEKLVLLVINNIFYTSPLTVAWLCIWYRLAGFTSIHWEVILVVTLINVICVLFVIHVYETIFMMKEQQNEQVRNALLSSAKAEAELQALRNQIDPHFMFNSLNSLSHLITSDPKKALVFTDNLAEIYRYILSQKDQTLVLLQDELNFLNKYTSLLALRFGRALEVVNDVSITMEQEFLIPPISAFLAMENAVKHNEISETAPLKVYITIDGNMLCISNKLQEKRSIRHSSKIGLKNLDERFRIISGQGISVRKDVQYFHLQMPLTKLNI